MPFGSTRSTIWLCIAAGLVSIFVIYTRDLYIKKRFLDDSLRRNMKSLSKVVAYDLSRNFFVDKIHSTIVNALSVSSLHVLNYDGVLIRKFPATVQKCEVDTIEEDVIYLGKKVGKLVGCPSITILETGFVTFVFILFFLVLLSFFTVSLAKSTAYSNGMNIAIDKIEHEIRSPFTKVQGIFESIETAHDFDTFLSARKQYISSFNFAKNSVDTILRNFGRLNRDTSINTSAQNIRDYINDIAIDYPIVTNYCADIFVQIDSYQFRSVILNIVKNAIEANAKKIEVSTEVVRNNLFIRISNNGSEIPDKLKNKIFNRYHTTKKNGIGIGLEISREIVSKHGGSLELEASNADSTVFVISLPFKEAQKNNTQTLPSHTQSRELLIFALDDEIAYLNHLEMIFKKEKVKFITFDCRDTLLSKTENLQPDIIFLDHDLNSNEFDGSSICKEIRAFDELVTIIIHSKCAISKKIEGVDRFIPKPLNQSELGKIIQKESVKPFIAVLDDEIDNLEHFKKEAKAKKIRASFFATVESLLDMVDYRGANSYSSYYFDRIMANEGIDIVDSNFVKDFRSLYSYKGKMHLVSCVTIVVQKSNLEAVAL